MWASSCDKQQVDAFRCDVIKILDLLLILLSSLRKVMNTGLLDAIGQLFLPSMIKQMGSHWPTPRGLCPSQWDF